MSGLIESARFFELPAAATSLASGGDRFAYKITVEANGQVHTVEMEESEVPPESRPMLDWLASFARRHRRGARH